MSGRLVRKLGEVKKLSQLIDSVELIRGRAPFVSKTANFRGYAIMGVTGAYIHGRYRVDVERKDRGDVWTPLRLHVPNQYVPETYSTFLQDLQDVAEIRGNLYIVESYDQVIAWTNKTGKLIVPDHTRASPTTQRHVEFTRKGAMEFVESPRVYASIDEIKSANRHIGHMFFNRDSVAYWRSRIESDVIAGRFFITSEQLSGDGSGPRTYAIRVARNSGDVKTIDNGLESRQSALDMLKGMLSSYGGSVDWTEGEN